MPPESSRGKRPPKPSRPTRLSSSSIQTRSGLVPLISKGKLMLASRLRQGSRLASWNTMPISGFGPVTGLPSSRTSPAVRRCSPDIDHSSVVLPQPDGPTIETISPSIDVERAAVDGQQVARPGVVDLGGALHPELRVAWNAQPSSSLALPRADAGTASSLSPCLAVCNYPTFRVKRHVIELSSFSRNAAFLGILALASCVSFLHPERNELLQLVGGFPVRHWLVRNDGRRVGPNSRKAGHAKS